MTPEQFAYWLQGFFELSDPSALSGSQVDIIREHLKTVFEKRTTDIKPMPATPRSLPFSYLKTTVIC